MESTPLHDEVHQLALDIVNASAIEDRASEWAVYTKLRELCESNEASELNHPLQWESLGDFTIADDKAIPIYLKALEIAEKQNRIEYIASINFALAERHLELKEPEGAYRFARQANEAAKNTDDLELRKEISEFLLAATKIT